MNRAGAEQIEGQEQNLNGGYVTGYAKTLFERIRLQQHLQGLGVRTPEQQQELAELNLSVEAMSEVFFGLLGTTKEEWLESQKAKGD